MKRLTTIIFLVMAVTGLGQSAELWVPADYVQVSEALEVAVAGDIVKVSPGSYTDYEDWYLQEGVSVEGTGTTPQEVKYLVPDVNGTIFLYANTRLENLQIGTVEDDYLIGTNLDATGIVLRNLILYPLQMHGAYIRGGSDAVCENLTIIGNGEGSSKAMKVGDEATCLFQHCVVKNFNYVFHSIPTAFLTERFNCFDNVEEFNDASFPTDPDPTDIFGTTGITPPNFAPPAGSIVIDAGDPTVWDPDGTIRDIGAVIYNQTSHLIGWGSPPTKLPGLGIGDPPYFFTPGDECALYSVVTKPEGYPVPDPGTEVDIYLILDVYGEHWFWPSWSQDIDFRTIPLTEGYYSSECIFNFTWPTGTGSASGLRFWACTMQMTPESFLLGPVAMLEFGYSEE